jgi:hypothetical protein
MRIHVRIYPIDGGYEALCLGLRTTATTARMAYELLRQGLATLYPSMMQIVNTDGTLTLR